MLHTNNIRAAFSQIETLVNYTIYYDLNTSICTAKSIDPLPIGINYIIVDRAGYQLVDVCSNYKFNGVTIEKIPLANRYTWKKLSHSNNGQFSTTKNNMIFLTDSTDNIDKWDYVC